MVWVNTSPLVKTYTLEEFWALPEPPDHSKLELIAGVLYLTPPPGYTHDNAVSRLIRILSEYLIKTGHPGTFLFPVRRYGRVLILTLSLICSMSRPKPKRLWIPSTAPQPIW